MLMWMVSKHLTAKKALYVVQRTALAALLFAFAIAADDSPGVSVLLRPQDEATVDEVFKTGQESEQNYWNAVKAGSDITQTNVDFDTATYSYSYLFQYYGHYESLRRAVKLLRHAAGQGKFSPKRMGGNADDSIELNFTEIIDSKEPMFQNKYRIFVVWIKNETDHDIELSGISLKITDIKGEVHENIDLRSDPALWEKVKTTPHMWNTRRVIKGTEGLGKGAVPKFMAPIASVRVDLEKEGVIEIPYLENLYGDI
ncbi:MAG: hypothetical protein ACREJQ_03930 [bacterium]